MDGRGRSTVGSSQLSGRGDGFDFMNVAVCLYIENWPASFVSPWGFVEVSRTLCWTPARVRAPLGWRVCGQLVWLPSRVLSGGERERSS